MDGWKERKTDGKKANLKTRKQDFKIAIFQENKKASFQDGTKTVCSSIGMASFLPIKKVIHPQSK